MLKYVVLLIGVVTALHQLGVNMASILASMGVAGLTIGFAARDALSNIISGLFIFWDRPFVIGDLIEIGDHYGRVEEITMRSTRVVTPDGKMLAIPNTEISKAARLSSRSRCNDRSRSVRLAAPSEEALPISRISTRAADDRLIRSHIDARTRTNAAVGRVPCRPPS